MSGKIQIGIIFGGRSGEHEVSLMSARSVISVLDPDQYNVTAIGITPNGAWVTGADALEALEKRSWDHLPGAALLPEPRGGTLFTSRVLNGGLQLNEFSQLDVIFPVLHGTFGEDGCIQGLFEMANVAYIGPGVLSSSLGMDKGVFKDVMRTHNLPVLESKVFSRREILSSVDEVVEEAECIAPYPLFTKPVNLGSSVGITKCKNRAGLKDGLLSAARYDRRVLVERGISAREIEISVLGNDQPRASVAGEIIPMAEFYTYEAKYEDDRTRLVIPAPISPEQLAYIQDIALRTFRVCDCAGLARVDFLLEKETGKFYLSEYNTIPGFTQVSMYPKLWEASGLLYPALINRLVELALERRAEINQLERKFRRDG